MADLRWHQTESDGILTFRSAIPTLRALSENCTGFDVELFGTNTACNKLGIIQPIRAHEMVLMHASKHFHKVFTDRGYIDSVVRALTRTFYRPQLHQTQYTLSGISHESLSDIVKFIYTGELNFHADRASERMQKVLVGAKFLVMPDLATACETYLASDKHLNLENCMRMLRFARKCTCSLLLVAVLDLAAKNLPYFTQSSEFLELTEEEIVKVLSDPVISLADPDQRCRAAVAWLNYGRASRDACVGGILDKVPFDLNKISVATLVAAWDNAAIRTKYAEKFMNVIADKVKKFQCDDHRYYSNRAVSDVLWNADSSRDTWFVMGGAAANACKDFVMYDVKRQFWSKLPDLPWTRSYAGACVMDKSIFLLGGGKNNQISADIDLFNLLTHTWTQNDSGVKLSCARERVSVCVTGRTFNSVEQSAFIIGGLPHENTMEKLNVWDDDGKLSVNLETLPKMIVGRHKAMTVWAEQTVFVAGGGNAQLELNNSRLSSIEKYDCVTKNWSTVGNLNCGRSSSMSVVLGDDWYLVGGYDGKTDLGVVEVFNTRTGQIRQAPSILKARAAGSGVALDRNTLCAVGGCFGDTNSPMCSVECFDIRQGKWTTGVIVPDMPTANFQFGFVSFSG